MRRGGRQRSNAVFPSPSSSSLPPSSLLLSSSRLVPSSSLLPASDVESTTLVRLLPRCVDDSDAVFFVAVAGRRCRCCVRSFSSSREGAYVRSSFLLLSALLTSVLQRNAAVVVVVVAVFANGK